MILEIKRKKKEKRIQIVGALLGICVAATALFYFFHVEKAEAERRNPKAFSVRLKVPDR